MLRAPALGLEAIQHDGEETRKMPAAALGIGAAAIALSWVPSGVGGAPSNAGPVYRRNVGASDVC